MRLVLYTGKGGVGKTTVAAATAVRAAERGRRCLVASADAAHGLGDVLERRLGPEPTSVTNGLDAVEIDARVELERHWGGARRFLAQLFRHQGIEAVVADELALLPGADEVTALLRVEELARSGRYDLVVVDCAPTDASLRLMTLPDVAQRSLRVLLPLFGALSGVAAPIARRLVELPLPDAAVFADVDELVNRRLGALQQLVTDPGTSVRIVLTPERMVIDEAHRAWGELSLFEVGCDAVVMNRLLPEEATREAFFDDWGRRQARRRAEVEERFAPHPVLVAPLLEDEATGLAPLARLGSALFAEHAPEALLSPAARVEFRRSGSGVVAAVPLPGVDPGRLDVAVVDGSLTITAGLRRRTLALPRAVAALDLCSARLEDRRLLVRFEPTAGAAG